MSVITQNGFSALMEAARRGMTEIVSQLLEAGANTDLQNKVWRVITNSTALLFLKWAHSKGEVNPSNFLGPSSPSRY